MTKKYSRILCGAVAALFTILAGARINAQVGGFDIDLEKSSGNTCSSCCFPSSLGWDKYQTVTNFYFVGPYSTNTTYLGVPCMANTNHYTNLVIRTCAASNGTNLQTGIRIQNLSTMAAFCRTNNCGNLTSNSVKMVTTPNRAVYGVQVFYKQSTLGTNASIHVDWEYKN
jgi:hypothetical protein